MPRIDAAARLRPGELEDRATFEEPRLLTSGMHGVWVDGDAVLLDGESVVGEGRGQALRGVATGSAPQFPPVSRLRLAADAVNVGSSSRARR